MNTKTILGLSFAAVFAVFMIGPAYAVLPGWAELISAESAHHNAKGNPNGKQPDRNTIEASTNEAFTTCPDDAVCGIGSFVTGGTATGVADHAMAVAAIHVPFCDHPFQDDDCVEPESIDWNDPDAPHPHILFFDDSDDCSDFEGVKLVAENDLDASILEITGTYLELKIPTGDGEVTALAPEVHTWTVDIGDNDAICPVILDTASDED